MKTIRISHLFLLFGILIISCSKAQQTDEIKESTEDGPEITEVKRYLHRVILSWSAVNGSSRYEIRYAKNSSMEKAVVLKSGMTFLEVGGLDANQAYYWQTRAEINGGWTDWSPAKQAGTASYATSVATYNILGAEHDANIEPDFAWHLRRDAVRNIILQRNNNPDIIGVQEARVQIGELVNLLKQDYHVHVSARSLSPQAIFWKPEKFELIGFNDDIDIFGPSISGYTNQRYVTQVRLRELNTGTELLVYNLHIPSGSNADRQQIRGTAARNIVAHAKAQITRFKIPVILLGDFNNYPETVIDGLPSSPMVIKGNGFQDVFDIADNRVNADYGTTVNRVTSGARRGENGSMRVDYIFVYPSDQIAVTQQATIINFEGSSSTLLERPIPSDHHPVRAVLHLSY
ncbi:endonuclease/exonuclease/phosphatase family protein [Sphingobacterium haloxyli]|uniref:Endonuclease/exonuclease/phosphatase domain-containing protein n=1 Tax=Sphingobacterium haloxyli TaxID=2100533 RepID=A0A2S9IY97_9SPHI|nr:endonuclease/exonuclease/phosphatase family protein [Sphingobacterium haloxyli]PRD45504.1 hypothetical protein C5745_18105 [Sphingobacterium haloxyli]